MFRNRRPPAPTRHSSELRSPRSTSTTSYSLATLWAAVRPFRPLWATKGSVVSSPSVAASRTSRLAIACLHQYFPKPGVRTDPLSSGPWAECARWSGVRATVDGQIRTGDVRGLRTSHERHQRGDLLNMSVAVERCGGLLRHCPIARGGIQIRVDRTRLDVVDRDTPAPYLSGQPLSKHFHGSLRGRVGYQTGREDTLAHGRADHNDATATVHVLKRR